MFGGATLVGVSRVCHDQHWASDVLVGVASGTFSVIKIMSYAHRNTTNRIDGWLLAMAVLPGWHGSLPLAWTLPGPFGRTARK